MTAVQDIHGLSIRVRMTSGNLPGHFAKELLSVAQGREVSSAWSERVVWLLLFSVDLMRKVRDTRTWS